jgi:hypothetical protein
MSNPSALGAISYAAESAWGEDVTTFSTLRVPIIAPVDCSGLKHDKIDPKRVVQYRNDNTQFILATMGGSFKTKLYLTGHGSTTAGAVTAGLTETLLGYVFGNTTVSAANGTTITGGTAAAPTTTASGTFAAGSLCRIGSANDTRGNGQFAAIATHVTTTLNLLTAIDGAPNNADVLYSAVNIYPSENPTTTSVTGLRFLLQTANLCYEAHGCYPMAVTISGLNPGEVPAIEVTWGVSWWRYSTATFPSTVTTEIFQPAATAGGSVFLQAFGTTTRQKYVARNVSITYKLGMVMLEGYGGVSQYQKCVGARRIPDVIDVKFTIDADAQTTTPALDSLATGTVGQQLLITLNPTIGTAVGLYLPNLAVSQRSLQRIDKNINRYDFVARAMCSTTTTSDLTLSAFRMAFA